MLTELEIQSVIEGFYNRVADSLSNERDVKNLLKRVLNHFDIFYFMPAANGFGRAGVSDFILVNNGCCVAIETKFGRNTPTAQQLKFGQDMLVHGAPYAVVRESNFVSVMTIVIAYLLGVISRKEAFARVLSGGHHAHG